MSDFLVPAAVLAVFVAASCLYDLRSAPRRARAQMDEIWRRTGLFGGAIVISASLIVALTAGALIGHLLAGLRSFPEAAGSVRTARPTQRRPEDYVSRMELTFRWASAVLLLGVLALCVVVLSQPGETSGRLLLAIAGAGLLLNVIAWAVTRTLLGRRLPSGSSDELRWREALLATTLQDITNGCTQTNGIVAPTGLVNA